MNAMGETVGTEDGYCTAAEHLMERAIHLNMRAGRLENPLRKRGLPVPDAGHAALEAKKSRAAAEAAITAVQGCVRCDLSAIRADWSHVVCPLLQFSIESE